MFDFVLDAAYWTLIDAVSSPPVFALPPYGLPYSLETDASDHQVECALSQTY